MGSIDRDERTYPLKRPRGHKPPVQRWSMTFPAAVKYIYTLYVGIQSRGNGSAAQSKAESIVQALLDESKAPAIDTFRVTNGFDVKGSRVWVAYWTNEEDFKSALKLLDLARIWESLGDGKHDVGLWREDFAAPKERLETNYARLDHKPGLAKLPDTEQPSHNLTAYWGAGRDRIPASAHDRFETPKEIPLPSNVPTGFGQRLTGSNYENMCHIRSGQWWELCEEAERESYENDLEPKLMGGMNYLWENPEETGTIGLRFLQNLNDNGEPIKETCGAGFHKNWADLEKWSSRHPSHLAIFNGMMAHAKKFGDGRKLMTWHEVWIFKEGEARFDYVNCDPTTGVIRFVELEQQPLST
ncbi:unnamed protein product [Zymoseptoria tritici ST99CH_1E4]|uniref:Uncharacterized protein n=1 Tax=Zymoseptoria tritici ST99CH_1E4 TaxID=1276532 RepID=A0A2H1FLH0_ZYMTR|nr:unnamed protein product [Zymoseptoria tritici ST99CH_1E4]